MQKDLFGVSSLESQAVPKMGFLERHRYSLRLDHILAVFILLLIVYVLVFSFGVETGKRYALAELKAERAKRELMIHELSEKVFAKARQEEMEIERGSQAPADLSRPFSSPEQASEPSQVSFSKTPSAGAPSSAASGMEKAKKVNSAGKYTIQIVTLTSQKATEEALKKFAQKGLEGFVIPSGKYLQVCVDSFESREKALESLKHLKMRGIAPPDAYVRFSA